MLIVVCLQASRQHACSLSFTQTGHACCIKIVGMFATSMCLNIQFVCLLVFSPHKQGTLAAFRLPTCLLHQCAWIYNVCACSCSLHTHTGHACCIQIAGMFATSMCLNIQCVCLLVFSPHKQGTLAAFKLPACLLHQCAWIYNVYACSFSLHTNRARLLHGSIQAGVRNNRTSISTRAVKPTPPWNFLRYLLEKKT